MIQISTRRDVCLYTIKRTGVAICLAPLLALSACVLVFGTDMSKAVPVSEILLAGLAISLFSAAVLSWGLIYPCATLLRQLSVTRQELFQLSRTDQLTGLLNRRGFDDKAIGLLHDARQRGMQVGAMMCDIDRFKDINDQLGHDCGDQVLVDVGALLRAFGERHGLVVARHGGEEFVAFGLFNSTARVRCLAEELRQSVARHPFELDRSIISATISIGVAVMANTTALGDLMRSADEALYAAKNAGRNCTFGVAPPVASLVA
jgi:diguanylate cyclase (GGDEF)-like protein